MADATMKNPIFQLWRKQFEEAAAAGARLMAQAPAPPTDPTAFWRPVLNQGLEQWARMFAQTPATPDLSAQWKQFLDQWIEAWSRVLGPAMNTDAFAKLMGQSLENMLAAQAPLKKQGEQAIEQAVTTLNRASR